MLCTGSFSICFLLCDIENELKFANALFNQILNALSNVARLENVVLYFQCILDVSLQAIASHVCRLTHPTETAIRRLVYIKMTVCLFKNLFTS